MDRWVIDYALHVKSIKEAGYSQDEVAGFCDAVDACLAARGFEKVERLGLHTSTKVEALSDAFLACADLSAIDGSERFISKLNLFRVNDLNDLLPVLLAGNGSTGNHRTHQQIDAANLDNAESPNSDVGISTVSTVAAVIQDLLLDGPGLDDHKRTSRRQIGHPPEKHVDSQVSFSLSAHQENNMSRQTHSPPAPPPTSQPLWAFGVRMFWVMVGPGLLALMLLLMGMQKKVWFAAIDGVFVGVLCLLILARWIDFRFADPTLTTGEIATAAQIRNYAIVAVVLGIIAWLIATLLGIYVLG